MKIKWLMLIICFFAHTLNAQTLQLLAVNKETSLRGLSVVNDKVIWVSGSNGTVGKSLDSGYTWKWMLVKGFEKSDFRDIEAFNANTAIIMSVADPAYILKTIDGGETWKIVYENKTKGMFLDAMEFWNEISGIVIGDPIDNKIFIARTFDGGNKWQTLPPNYYPIAANGEACFASSGTNVAALNNKEAVFVTGGVHSRMFIRDNKFEMPILQGTETTGANSVAVKNAKNKTTLIVVGGDFMAKDSATKNCCITTDGGKSFTIPSIAPHGYRSCVAYLEKNNWITCGLNGVDYSTDDGNTWTWISKSSFNVCKKAKKGSAVFLAGNGEIAKLILP